jgi:hypothetical protein
MPIGILFLFVPNLLFKRLSLPQSIVLAFAVLESPPLFCLLIVVRRVYDD